MGSPFVSLRFLFLFALFFSLPLSLFAAFFGDHVRHCLESVFALEQAFICVFLSSRNRKSCIDFGKSNFNFNKRSRDDFVRAQEKCVETVSIYLMPHCYLLNGITKLIRA